jgi:transcriptional regulator with XRE-family HTH domain
MRVEELYERRQQRELTMAEAAEILGVTEQTFRRWGARYEADARLIIAHLSSTTSENAPR